MRGINDQVRVHSSRLPSFAPVFFTNIRRRRYWRVIADFAAVEFR